MRKVEPVFFSLLVRLQDVEEKREEVSDGGIIMGFNDSTDHELAQQGMKYAFVVEIGPYVGFRRGIPDEFQKQPFKKGDKVLIHKHAGILLEDFDDGHVYRLIDDLDIKCIFKDEGIEL